MPYYVNCDIIKRYTNGNPVGVVAKELDMLGTGETAADIVDILRSVKDPQCTVATIETMYNEVTRRSTTVFGPWQEIANLNELRTFIAEALPGSVIRIQWKYGEGIMVELTIPTVAITFNSKMTAHFSGEDLTVYCNSRMHTFNEVQTQDKFKMTAVSLPKQIVAFIGTHLPQLTSV